LSLLAVESAEVDMNSAHVDPAFVSQACRCADAGFSLAVWYSEKAIDNQPASQIYDKLCKAQRNCKPPHASVADFYDELVSICPEAEQLVDHERERPVWSEPIHRSGRHVLMNVKWSRVKDVVPFILQLSYQHGLVVFATCPLICAGPDGASCPDCEQ
jgi:hypothetical protein